MRRIAHVKYTLLILPGKTYRNIVNAVLLYNMLINTHHLCTFMNFVPVAGLAYVNAKQKYPRFKKKVRPSRKYQSCFVHVTKMCDMW